MTKLFAAALATAALALPATAFAQDATPPASGIHPYVGVLGGYDSYSPHSEFGTAGNRGAMNGGLVSGVGGVDVPLGPVVVGAEGNAAYGFVGNIDWEYGVKGRVGVRAGATGLLFVSGGYEWVNGRGNQGFPDHSDWIYGGGIEVGPKDLGLASASASGAGPRLRLQADTYDFHSFRPMAGIVFGF